MVPRIPAAIWTGCLVCAIAFCLPGGASAKKFHVLHAFADGTDGASPDASLIADRRGNRYGTALQGGAENQGVVFEVAANGTETIVYSFQGGNDGSKPEAGLVADAAGNFYDTTYLGGPDDDCTVFKLAPNGTETALYAFTGGADGANPQASLIRDKSGNLYGTASAGGSSGCGAGCGTVFKLAADRTLTVLHAFSNGSDGSYPQAGLLADAHGSLFGTASAGGASGNGTIFKLTADGAFKVLYAFAGGHDGADPVAGLMADGAGNLYGTTRLGGRSGCPGSSCATVFKLARDCRESVLHAFSGGREGGEPYAGVIMDANGNLYGTTISGGSKNGYGTTFKLAPDGTLSVLHVFAGASDGEYPNAGVIAGKDGTLYGTTYTGGPAGWGTIFEIEP